MKPEIDSQKLNAFVDGELDVLSLREIEQRMQRDPALLAQVEGLRQLRESLRDAAEYHLAPEALRQRVAAMGVAQRPATPRAAAIGVALQQWVHWRPMLVSFAMLALAIAVLNPTGWRFGDGDRLREEVIASHVRSTLGQHLVDIASSDHHTVKPWLSEKLDFSPPVPESPFPGAVFVGGRIDYLGGRPVAALVYRQGGHVVSSFVSPTPAADRSAEFSAERGFRIAHWAHAGMNHWVISDLNQAEFEGVVRGLALAESPP